VGAISGSDGNFFLTGTSLTTGSRRPAAGRAKKELFNNELEPFL
jgi:hypothetical protein